MAGMLAGPVHIKLLGVVEMADLAVAPDKNVRRRDLEAGGDIARNLHGLYFFVSDRLLEANVANRVQALEEAIVVLKTLHEAWVEITNNGKPAEEASTDATKFAVR